MLSYWIHATKRAKPSPAANGLPKPRRRPAKLAGKASKELCTGGLVGYERAARYLRAISALEDPVIVMTPVQSKTAAR